MRNLFDQYESDENRLTHALVCCLAEDPLLLRRFVHWATDSKPPARKRLRIVEQTLPGEDELPESEAERRGLPDAWIHDDDKWSLVIESKVSSPVNADQLRRHERMILRRGFEDFTLLVISPERSPSRSLVGAKHKTWSEVYTWLSKQGKRSAWGTRLTNYMEIAEERMTASGYLNKGTLTRFSGIPFDADNPYNYGEAKRILRLVMNELRKNRQLERRLDMDPDATGRTAITGSAGTSVWDYLSLKRTKKAKLFTELFTEFPHLTLDIQQARVQVVVIIPNGMRQEFRRNLLELGADGFSKLICGIARDLGMRLKKAKGASPWMEAKQRHYPTRTRAVRDACLEFDPRTAIDEKGKRQKADRLVKSQPQWLDATFEAWSAKRSNLQLAIGATFPYTCDVLHSREALKYIAETWLACEPLIKAALGR